MALAPWQAEWVKFDSDSVQDMKMYADQTHTHKEWMCYVYEQDYGILVPGDHQVPQLLEKNEVTVKFTDLEGAESEAARVGGQVVSLYQLGAPSYGTESRIEVNPEAKAVQDRAYEGLRKENRKWTIHGHPLKDGKIYTGRQYFSSTDVVNEFCDARDKDERVVQFLVYPHQQKDSSNGQKVIHNRCRILIFPDRNTIVQAMKDSNPGVDAMAITPQSGQNQSVPDGSGGTTLENDSGVNWFEFQESLGRMGQMGIVDIEGPRGGIRFHSEGALRHLTIFNVVGFLSLVGLGALLWQGNRTFQGFRSQAQETLGRGAEVETIDSFNVEGGEHHWK